MWRACGEELVGQFLAGHNGTLLAYGQTGSGKTYTMGTDGARLLRRAGSTHGLMSTHRPRHVTFGT